MPEIKDRKTEPFQDHAPQSAVWKKSFQTHITTDSPNRACGTLPPRTSHGKSLDLSLSRGRISQHLHSAQIPPISQHLVGDRYLPHLTGKILETPRTTTKKWDKQTRTLPFLEFLSGGLLSCFWKYVEMSYRSAAIKPQCSLPRMHSCYSLDTHVWEQLR